jgi:uncharacterized membrane protein YkvI
MYNSEIDSFLSTKTIFLSLKNDQCVKIITVVIIIKLILSQFSLQNVYFHT